jgi:putative ATP-binding cassette transporter
VDLKEANKVVIVISHDDRYFDYADQLIVMENGTVKSITHNTAPKLSVG